MTTIEATADVQRRIAERDALERRRARALTLAVIEGLFGDCDDDPDAHDVQRAAAVLLRRQGEQLDTLRKAIGDPDNLRLLADTFDLPILARIAAAVPQDPERCACGKPATGTVGGVPTCGDDR